MIEFPLAKSKEKLLLSKRYAPSFRLQCGLRDRFFHCLLLQPSREISLRPWFYAIVPFSEVPPAQFPFLLGAKFVYWQPIQSRQFEKPHSTRQAKLLLMLATHDFFKVLYRGNAPPKPKQKKKVLLITYR